MEIIFYSPCELVRVRYSIHGDELPDINIVDSFVDTREGKWRIFQMKYWRNHFRGAHALKPFTTLSNLSLSEREKLNKLPFNENGPTPEIKAKILEAIKEQLTII